MKKQKASIYVVANVYVDGSYCPDTRCIGCAALLFIDKNKRPCRIAYRKELKDRWKYGANIAEMAAVKSAVKAACSLGVAQISLYYDWEGLEFFLHQENVKKRHNSCPYYIQYADYMEKVRKNVELKFIKVKAHSGDKCNNWVDKMEKYGRTL